MTRMNSAIYSYSCGKIDYDEEYIGETSKTFGERFKEHLKAPPPVYDHQSNTGHTTSIENLKIISRKRISMARTIKEVMYIRMNNPTLNRNIGKYNFHTFGTEFCISSQNSE